MPSRGFSRWGRPVCFAPWSLKTISAWGGYTPNLEKQILLETGVRSFNRRENCPSFKVIWDWSSMCLKLWSSGIWYFSVDLWVPVRTNHAKSDRALCLCSCINQTSFWYCECHDTSLSYYVVIQTCPSTVKWKCEWHHFLSSSPVLSYNYYSLSRTVSTNFNNTKVQ